MMTIQSLQKTMVLWVAALFMLALPALGMAQDRLELNDGRVLEGTVSRDVDGYIWFRFRTGSLESEQMFTPGEIKKLTRQEGAGGAQSEPVRPAAEPKKEVRARGTGVPSVAILSLGGGPSRDMVGIYMTAETLRRAIPILEEDGVDTVVLRINSGGGYTYEVQHLSDVIHNEFKPTFRTVAWIESAISAAAMTSHTVEEIYFMTQGNYGAATEFSGNNQATKDRPLEERLYQMERISQRGNHHPAIARAMQIMSPLSCTIDEHGDVHWFATTDGEHLVNPEGRVLSFNARDAVRFKFARGIADDYQTLGRLMGYNEVEFVGKMVAGVPFPVSRAEEMQRRFRDQVAEDERRTNAFMIQFEQAVQMAQGQPADRRGPFIGQARQALQQIDRMVQNNPNFALFIFGVPPRDFRREFIEPREEMLRRLARR
jgi:hypothetical protein